jgi:hypothetical protein
MALKDTLQQLNDKARQPSLDRKAYVKDWQDAVLNFFDKIRDYLKEYAEDGSLRFSALTQVGLSEEALGNYTVSMMRITAGPAIIEVRPVGRMIVGASGRVDLYRQGRSSPSQRVLALRVSYPPEEEKWELVIPPTDRSFELMSPAALAASLRPERRPLDKANLEVAIERILQ